MSENILETPEKKKRGRPRKHVPGSFDPVPVVTGRQTTIGDLVDTPPPDVVSAAAEYIAIKRKIAAFREEFHYLLANLITAMRAAGVTKMLIDDGDKYLTFSSEDKVKITRKKKTATD